MGVYDANPKISTYQNCSGPCGRLMRKDLLVGGKCAGCSKKK